MQYIIIEYTKAENAYILEDDYGDNFVFSSEAAAEIYAEENCSTDYMIVQIG